MNNKAAVGSKRLAVSVLVGLSVFMLCAPVMPASTVRAEGCRHDEYEWVDLIKPTCSRAGKKIKICQDCEEILETEIIDKTEHKCKWEKTREATCAAAGIRSYVCKNCRAVVETEIIPTKNHRFIWNNVKKITCGEGGMRQQVCKNCGNLGQTETFSPTGKHKYDSWSIKSIAIKGRTIKVTEERMCKVCKQGHLVASGTTAAFSQKHNCRKYYYKYTKGTGKIVILCSECHQSVTGKITGGNIRFTKPKKDNSKHGAKAWKRLDRY